AEGGPSATFAFVYQLDPKAGGLKDTDGSRADVRFVVTHKGVIPEKDPATRRILQVRSAGEPAIEALAGIMRQRTLPGDPEQFRQDAADDQRIQQAIGHRGRATAPFAELVHRTENSLSPR